ncbi:MAG: hypothetical protein FWD62_15530 [Betaproteobacteria bacterium]|nr:hypothetical protein [Betaproteobacteria bacterium]
MTNAEIIARLRALSAEMQNVGTAMDYFGGFDGKMAQHGTEMVAAGMIAEEWADEIEAAT